jgi:hypothetical protein
MTKFRWESTTGYKGTLAYFAIVIILLAIIASAQLIHAYITRETNNPQNNDK